MKQVGVLGGTFDPPHLGHLIIAEEVKRALDLDEVWFIPTNEPPHKTKTNTPVNERINMLEIATQSNPAFHVNTMETERLGKSYTFDTMKVLTEEYPTLLLFYYWRRYGGVFTEMASDRRFNSAYNICWCG